MPVRVVAVISESHSLGFYVPAAQGPCNGGQKFGQKSEQDFIYFTFAGAQS